MRKQLPAVSHPKGIFVRPLWAKLVTAELKKHGANVERALTEAGLDQRAVNNVDGWIPFFAHARLMEAAAQDLDDPCFGLHFSKTIDIRDAGLVAYLGIASKTMEDGLINLAQYLRVFSEAFQIDLKVDGDMGAVIIVAQDPSIAQFRQAAEFAYCVILHAYRHVTGKHLTASAVHFLHHRRSHVLEFNRYFGCPVKYGRNQGQMVFTRRTLATPILSADDRLLAILRKHADDVLSRRPAHRDQLVEKIERRLSELLPTGRARIKIIAGELGMSERTLVRRLAELNTSYAEIVEQLRRQLSRKYLAQHNLSFTHIAFLMGYSNQSAFTTACKRWTGHSPRELREELQKHN